MMKEVECLICHKTVVVKLEPFGDGCLAICPKCDNLAFVGEINPQDVGKEQTLAL